MVEWFGRGSVVREIVSLRRRPAHPQRFLVVSAAGYYAVVSEAEKDDHPRLMPPHFVEIGRYDPWAAGGERAAAEALVDEIDGRAGRHRA